VFADAGFVVDSSSSSLLTFYELTGLYVSDEWSEGVEEEVLYAPASFGCQAKTAEPMKGPA
jgi:hypothetical protein